MDDAKPDIMSSGYRFIRSRGHSRPECGCWCV